MSPKLDTVVLVGEQAPAARLAASPDVDLRVLSCPHTSPQACNKIDKDGVSNEGKTLKAFRAAARPAG